MCTLARLRGDMIAAHKYIWKKIIFKLKANIGTRTRGYKLSMNKFMPQIGRRFLTFRRIGFWSSFPMGIERTKKKISNFKMDFMKSILDTVPVRAGDCIQQVTGSWVMNMQSGEGADLFACAHSPSHS